MSPNPPPEKEKDVNQTLNFNEQSSSDEEGVAYSYEQLATDDDNQDEFDDFQALAESRLNSTSNRVKNDLTIGYSNDVDREFSRLESEKIVVDESKKEKISQIMLQIKLPNENIPQWAKEITEDVWKKKFVDNIQAKSQDLFATWANNK